MFFEMFSLDVWNQRNGPKNDKECECSFIGEAFGYDLALLFIIKAVQGVSKKRKPGDSRSFQLLSKNYGWATSPFEKCAILLYASCNVNIMDIGCVLESN